MSNSSSSVIAATLFEGCAGSTSFINREVVAWIESQHEQQSSLWEHRPCLLLPTHHVLLTNPRRLHPNSRTTSHTSTSWSSCITVIATDRTCCISTSNSSSSLPVPTVFDTGASRTTFVNIHRRCTHTRQIQSGAPPWRPTSIRAPSRYEHRCQPQARILEKFHRTEETDKLPRGGNKPFK